MKQRYYLLIILFFANTRSFAQSAADYALQITATVQQAPAQVKLQWKKPSTHPTYKIYRKTMAGTSWGTAIATLTATDSTYTDAGVVADSAYEYQIIGTGSITSTGYIYAGVNVVPIHHRGTLLLLVDSVFIDSCKNELFSLMKDISGDGWAIKRHNIARTTGDVAVHNIIANDYMNNSDVAAVLIIGHLAVPYSGDLNPDGHPQHLGAWSADVYYANMFGPWTDNVVSDTSGSYTANRNIPGDGKWDQTVIPSASQLQVGRIDFFNMPAFGKTEIQLMKSYLARDHQYKMDSLLMVHRALIYDNFGAFSGEAFAANGWRNFPPMVGSNNISALPFIASLNDSSYQWAYGCGGGSFTSASGIGTTTNFTTNNVNAIFTMLFGSFFGDWNVQNNFMRAPLCAAVPALTSCWAGRPNWFVHHMALGWHIGYSTLLTQNNSFLYGPASYGENYVHVALMGDLTLRTDYIKPPKNVVINAPATGSAVINWQPSPDAGVSGYYVYRSDTLFGTYKLLNTNPVAATLTDSFGNSGLKYYMVRAAKLTQTPSGSYYNLGIGIIDSANVKLFHVGVPVIALSADIKLYPNPAKDRLYADIHASMAANATIKLVNINGQVMMSTTAQLVPGKNTIGFNVQQLAPGNYIISIDAGDAVKSVKWVKMD
jgi:hypothetical protein